MFNEQEILAMQQLVNQVHIADAVLEYMLNLAEETRKKQHGLSTRGLLVLKKAAQAFAFIQQRSFVTPDDASGVCCCAAHRIGLSEAETVQLMQQVNIS